MGKHRSFQRMRRGTDQEDTKLAIQITLGRMPGGYKIGIGLARGVRQLLQGDEAAPMRENIKEALAKVLDACGAGAFDSEEPK